MPLPDPPVVIEFRDGERSVPPHVAANLTLAEIDPVLYTYEEAVVLSNNAIAKRLVNDFQWTVIHKHFLDNR